MCRVDDGEYAWEVSSRDDQAVADTELICEDCLRVIDPGEFHTRFSCTPGPGYEGDEPMYIFLAQMERDLKDAGTPERPWLTFDRDKPWFRIEEESAEIWECYGYHVYEEENPDLVEPDHISCAQCIRANRWLEVICQQTAVMCTREDLNEHLREYDIKILGPDFEQLVQMINNKWRRHRGNTLVTPEWVSYRTDRAITHAVDKNLQELAHA